MALRIIGRLLRGRHAGETGLAWNHSATRSAPASITLSSSAFPADGTIPRRFAGPGVGDNTSPALHWTNIPPGVVEWVLVMEDPDAPLPSPFVHMIAYGIPADAHAFAEGAFSDKAPAPIRFGRNTFSGSGYSGPRALPAHGPHRYVFQIFALNRHLTFSKAPALKVLLTAMEGAVIARGRLDGFFEQK